MVGFRALGASEPRQVRKEAALRIPSQVPRSRPAGAGDASAPRGSGSKTERVTGHCSAVGVRGNGDDDLVPDRRSSMSLLTIIIIVLVVLLVLGFLGRGRFRA